MTSAKPQPASQPQPQPTQKPAQILFTGPVDLLILGAGWTSDFLIPLLNSAQISFAATSRSGATRPNTHTPTLKFTFDPLSEDSEPFKVLPDAKTVLITFPIYVSGASERLVRLWQETHKGTKAGFIQLGSTGIWNNDPTLRTGGVIWMDRHSPFDTTNERAIAETELLKLSPGTPTTVLDLCGLWGGKRSTRNWVIRVAPTKEALRTKTSLHMIHGFDVARAVLAVHQHFNKAIGQRWLLTDLRVYDWWDLASAWGSGGAPAEDHKENTVPTGLQPEWVRELMKEEGVRALPRPMEMLGRCLESREFWETFGLSPAKARLEG